MALYLRYMAAVAAVLGCATVTAAQSFDAVGTRAAGMGGAFVAVADDASAAYWNPAGFASGNIFTVVLDRTTVKSNLALPEGARHGSGLLVALGVPALGLSYYRVRSMASLKAGTEGEEPDEVRMLVTHQAGATVLQSIGRGLAVGATLKLVRGSEPGAKASTKLDTDIGVMAAGSVLKAGLTIRNVRSPEFATADSGALKLPRQARAGFAVALLEGWIVDADFDLTSTRGASGAVREFATGTEGRLGRKALVRAGLRVNTRAGSDRAIAGGASYMIATSLFVDAQVTRGSSRADRGWGIAARLVY